MARLYSKLGLKADVFLSKESLRAVEEAPRPKPVNKKEEAQDFETSKFDKREKVRKRGREKENETYVLEKYIYIYIL